MLFLGSGGSMGIPVIGCGCEVCISKDPHNQRMRPSALIRARGKTILIDCGPDFHWQALKYNLRSLDGVIFTHAHYDHVSGIDEMRVFFMRQHPPIHCLLSHATYQELRKRFHYIFDISNDPKAHEKLVAKFILHALMEEQGQVDFLGLTIRYFSYEQASMQVTGYRMGNLAYVTDIRNYSDKIFNILQGIEILVVSALRHTPSLLHFSLDEAVAFSQRTGAKQTWLMHVGHEMDHSATNTLLPSNIRLAYDGLEIEFNPDH